MFTKFICMSKICLNQSIICLSKLLGRVYHCSLLICCPCSSGREKLGIKKSKNRIGCINYSETIDDVYENLGDYNPASKSVNIVWWYKSNYGS